MEKDGYTAVQLGSGLAKAKNVSKPMRKLFCSFKSRGEEGTKGI